MTHWFKIKFVENSREILFGIELKINTFEWAKKSNEERKNKWKSRINIVDERHHFNTMPFISILFCMCLYCIWDSWHLFGHKMQQQYHNIWFDVIFIFAISVIHYLLLFIVWMNLHYYNDPVIAFSFYCMKHLYTTQIQIHS